MKKTLLLLCLVFAVLLCASCKKAASEPGEIPNGCARAGEDNEAVDYTFCYPTTWHIDRNDGMVSVICNVGSGGTIANASVSVMAFALTKNTVANEYWDSYKADLKDVYGDKVEIQSEKEELRLDGTPACRNRYTLSLSDTTNAVEQVVCIRSGNVYLITFTSPETQKSIVSEGFETVLETFRFKQ